MMRFLLVEAAQVTVRSPSGVAPKIFTSGAVAGPEDCEGGHGPPVGGHLFWMMGKEWDYEQLKKFGSHAGEPGNRDGVPSNTE